METNFEGDIETEGDMLGPEEATEFRGLAATANYLGADRPDIQHATKELCRLMSRPTAKAMAKMKHLARYLKGKPVL